MNEKDASSSGNIEDNGAIACCDVESEENVTEKYVNKTAMVFLCLL